MKSCKLDTVIKRLTSFSSQICTKYLNTLPVGALGAFVLLERAAVALGKADNITGLPETKAEDGVCAWTEERAASAERTLNVRRMANQESSLRS